MSRRTAWVLAFALLASTAWGQDVPPRYRKAEGKLLKLEAGFGTPEVGVSTAALWSGDGKTAVVFAPVPEAPEAAPGKTAVVVVDVASGSVANDFIAPGALESAAVSYDGRFALFTSNAEPNAAKSQREQQWWDLRKGKLVKSFDRSEKIRIVMGLSPDGKTIVLGDFEGNAEFWDPETGKLAKKLEGRIQFGPISPQRALAFRPTHPQAIFFTDQGAELADLKTGGKLAKTAFASGPRSGWDFAPSGKIAALLVDDGIQVWDLEAKKSATTKYPIASASSLDLRLIDDKSALVVFGSEDQGTGVVTPGKVQRVDLVGGKIVWTAAIDLKGFPGVVVSADGKTAVLGSGLPPFRRISLADGSIVSAWGGHGDAVTGVAAAGKHFVSVGSDGLFIRWNGKGTEKTIDVGAPIRSLLPARNEAPLAFGGADGKIRFVEAGDRIRASSGHEGPITALARAPKSDWIVSASADRTLRTWDKEGKVLDIFSGHSEGINAVAVAPDEKWLISGSDDGTIRLWPIADGKLVPKGKAIVLDAHTRQVMCLALSEDGTKLASGSQDQTVKIWDLKKTKALQKIEGHKNWVTALLFDGDRLITASDDLTVRLWDAKGKQLDAVDLAPALDCPRSLARAEDGALLVGTSGWMILRYALPK